MSVYPVWVAGRCNFDIIDFSTSGIRPGRWPRPRPSPWRPSPRWTPAPCWQCPGRSPGWYPSFLVAAAVGGLFFSWMYDEIQIRDHSLTNTLFINPNKNKFQWSLWSRVNFKTDDILSLTLPFSDQGCVAEGLTRWWWPGCSEFLPSPSSQLRSWRSSFPSSGQSTWASEW